MPYDRHELKRRLRRARKLHGGTSIADMARITGRSPATIRRWESHADPSLPDLMSFVKVCRLYGFSADWVLFADTTPTKTDDGFASVLGHLAANLTPEEKSQVAEALLTLIRVGINFKPSKD